MSKPSTRHEPDAAISTAQAHDGTSDNAVDPSVLHQATVLEGIERGEHDIAEGRVLPHDEIRKRLARWLTETP